jgi:hypothetical protein
MEDIVAVEVRLKTGESRYFMTWGRIQDTIDPKPLAELILRHASTFAIADEPESARVLGSLHYAVQDSPLFFEALFSLASEGIPFGRRYEQWRKKKAREMEAGKEIWHLSHFGPPPGFARDVPYEPDATAS